MKTYLSLLLSLAVLLSGCTGLAPKGDAGTPLIKPPADATEAILIARDLARRDRWDEAIAVLAKAREQFPDEREILDEQTAMQQRRDHTIRQINDEILVGDAENQQAKITLLGRLSRLDRDNLLLTSRRLYWKEVLAGKVAALTSCAETHAEHSPALARRCYEQAIQLDADAGTVERLSAVRDRLQASEQEAVARQRLRQSKERQARAKVLLGEAKAAIDAREYRRALNLLAQVEALQPDNAEVAGLKQEAWSMISPQIEALVKLGDHLYLDEQLEAAVATWQAALTLKPDDEGLRDRIDRAKTVLDRLETLRQRQQPGQGPSETPPAGED